MDFIYGASLSRGGKAIIAMPSSTRKGESKISPTLLSGAGVVTSRAHIHYLVTEYGVVDLYGKSLQERAKLIISIAHPDHRETVYGASVFGQLLDKSSWFGVSYSASVLSNFSAALPSFDASGGIGMSFTAQLGSRFQLALNPGIGLRLDSKPAFRDADLFLGLSAQAIASFLMTDSFGFFIAWDSSYYFLHLDELKFKGFSLTNTATIGLTFRLTPETETSGNYIVY